jgi:hypothetical protein
MDRKLIPVGWKLIEAMPEPRLPEAHVIIVFSTPEN